MDYFDWQIIQNLIFRLFGFYICYHKADELNRSKSTWSFIGFFIPMLSSLWIINQKPKIIWSTNDSEDNNPYNYEEDSVPNRFLLITGIIIISANLNLDYLLYHENIELTIYVILILFISFFSAIFIIIPIGQLNRSSLAWFLWTLLFPGFSYIVVSRFKKRKFTAVKESKNALKPTKVKKKEYIPNKTREQSLEELERNEKIMK